jgi:Mor family transcriptional regulator
MQAESDLQSSRRIASHESVVTGAILKFLNEISDMTKHVRSGPSLADSDIWSTHACNLWSRTMQSFKAVFRLKFAKDSATLSNVERLFLDVQHRISSDCFNDIRSVIKQNKRRRLEEPRESSLLAVHVAATIQNYVGGLKFYLVRSHSWDQVDSHNCQCCSSIEYLHLQQLCISRLELLENVDIFWRQVAQEQRVYL